MLFELNDAAGVRVVQDIVAVARSRGERVGLTSGCFDLIHFQHVNFFIRCRRFCDHLIVGVDADEVVRVDKGPSRPMIPDFQRVLMVDALRSVSFAFVMNGLNDFGRAARLFTPDAIFKNDRFKDKEEEIVGREFAQRVIIIADQVYHNSTTEIIQHAQGRHAGG
jgi:D-beta-D-heptose 7-phosphate kinase / D-beta-D-heptose 1-phosphate adenosyltransferase